MAIVNKIRERSSWAVGFIAVALILFLIGGDFFNSSNGGSLFGSSNANSVGSINGTNVDYTQFSNLVEIQKAQFERQGRSATEQDMAQMREQIWEKMIYENAYAAEFEKLGITVSDEELKEMVQGAKNMHPYVKQQFSDQRGNFNAAQHAQFITSYTSNSMPIDQRTMWDNFKTELKTIRMREKYSALLNKMSYITQSEAKAEYTSNTEKASGKFLFVPFYSIIDSTIKVDDGEINSYYSAHKDDFVPFDSRSLSFASFQIVPTKEDSAALTTDIRNYAKGLGSSADAKAYANANSDIRYPYLRSASELSPDLKAALSTAVLGATIGPFRDGSVYAIHKYEGTQQDSLSSIRASHILIRADSTMSDSARVLALKSATDVLGQVRAGGNFAQLAQQFGTDGTAQKGGDLGVFQNNGSMIKEFERAVFGFNGTGVIPNLIKTSFGYHIVNVTEPKSNIKYKLATIAKDLQVGEAANNEMFAKVEAIRAKVKTLKDLEALAKKDNSITIQSADNLEPGATRIGQVDNAREAVNWAYGLDSKVGEIAEKVFVFGNTYVIAGLKSSTDKSDPKAMDFKDNILAKVRNQKKGEKILAKLADAKGDLAAVASKYGAGALVEEAKDVNFFSGMLNSAGYDPIGMGKLFGQKAGQRSKPFVGETGVMIMETLTKAIAPVIADYSLYKQQIIQRNGQGRSGMVGEQILRENAKIVDNRSRFF